MHNRIGFNRLNRKSSHRKALHRNMVCSLIKYERIHTTQAKAKAIRITAEKLVTRAGSDNVHNRRIAAKTIYDKEILNKLFINIAPRYKQRPGGYTRILKTGYRKGDAAEMVLLEFISEEKNNDEKKQSPRKKKSIKKKNKSDIQDKANKPDKLETKKEDNIDTKGDNSEISDNSEVSSNTEVSK